MDTVRDREIIQNEDQNIITLLFIQITDNLNKLCRISTTAIMYCSVVLFSNS